MNANPKVSVIIPVYKAEKYLPECVDSLLMQTYTNIEIILIDDGSPDSSPVICDEYEKNHENIVVLHKINEGAAVARQKGIDIATGQFIMFVDSDDWVEPDYVYSLVKVAIEKSVDAVIGNYKISRDNSIRVYNNYFEEGYYGRKQLEEIIYPHMLSAEPFYTFGITPSMWGKLFKTNMVKTTYTISSKKLSLGEDGCFTYSLLLKCNSIFIMPDSMYIYRANETSVTHSYNPEFVQETLSLKTEYCEIATQLGWHLGNQLDEYIAYICWIVVKNVLNRSQLTTKQIHEILDKYLDQNLPFNAVKLIVLSKAPLKKKIGYILLYGKKYKLIRLLSKNQ